MKIIMISKKRAKKQLVKDFVRIVEMLLNLMMSEEMSGTSGNWL